MNTINLNSAISHRDNNLKMSELYNEATEDYEFWSRDFNMHFGYYSPVRCNPFRRDSMLNEMNRQIYSRLGLTGQQQQVCDLGCGMGGTMKYGLTKYPTLRVTGVTLSDFQREEGNKRLEGLNGSILKEDYNRTPFASASLDGAMAIESFCHGGHSETSFREAYRILKPGARLVVADAFLKKDFEELCIGGSYCYKGLCSGWSLEKLGNIHRIKTLLEGIGFSEVRIEDISFRVAPSVLHVPFAITGFILKKLYHAENIKEESLRNLKGSLFALLSGVQMNNFGYYIITCVR